MRVNLYKRGKTWWGQWTDRGRSYRATTACTDRKAAELVARRWEREAADPFYRASYTTTLDAAIARLKDTLRREGKAAGTMNMYECKTAHLARVLKGDTPLGYIDAARVDSYISRREEEHAAPGTIHKELVALRRVLKVARRRGEYHHDPRAVMPERYSSGYVPRKRWVTPHELDRICAELKTYEAAAIQFLVATGARRSELWNTRREDVDLASGRVHLRGTKTGAALRTIPVLPPYRTLLETAVRNATGEETLHAPWPGINNRLRRVCEKLRIPHVSPNDLRRTHATWLVQSGVPRDLAGQMLGHVDDTMVRRIYAQLDDPEQLRQLVVRMLCKTSADSAESADHADTHVSEKVGHDRLELSANGLRDRRELRKTAPFLRSRADDVHGLCKPPWPWGPHRTFRIERNGRVVEVAS